VSSVRELCDRLAERERTSARVLADAYLCKRGCTAVVETVDVASGIKPRDVIEDVETAFDRWYWPRLEKQLEVDADYVPDMDIFHGTVLIAGAMGCEIRYTEGEWPWAMPVLKSIGEVDRIHAPDLKTSPAIQGYLSQIRWIQDKTEGRVPIKLMDLQSPFTTAAQMRHYEDLLVDMIDSPRQVKKLLDIITDVSLQFLRLQREVYVRPSFPGRNFPGTTAEDLGVCIADDTALIPLSPSMYEEFCLPTMLRIASQVPYVAIHSCGDYNHQVDNLLQIPNLLSLQMHTGPGEIDSLPAWRKVRGRVSLFSDTNAVSLGDHYANDYAKCYEEYVLPRLLEAEMDGLILQSPPAEAVDERQDNVRRLKEALARD